MLFSTRGGWVMASNHRQCKGRYTLSVKLSDFTVWRHTWMKKLSKLRSFDRQQCRPQNCPFKSSFTHGTAQFTQGISQFAQFTCRHHDVTRKRRHTQNRQKKNWQTWRETCAVPENIQFSFSCNIFFIQFSILSPAQYWVRSTNHLAPLYAISSIPPLPRPS